MKRLILSKIWIIWDNINLSIKINNSKLESNANNICVLILSINIYNLDNNIIGPKGIELLLSAHFPILEELELSKVMLNK